MISILLNGVKISPAGRRRRNPSRTDFSPAGPTDGIDTDMLSG
ncbi:hypothetical protein ABIE06_004528, partial [Pantoea dispersa]